MKIIPAEKKHAGLIANVIVTAVGREHCEEMAIDGRGAAGIEALFREMAERDDTQYSYRNALIATTDCGTPMGAIVAYDGGRLEELRRPFLVRLQEEIGIDPSDVPDETEPGEYYLDSLAVLPEYRGQGVASRLIAAAAERGHTIGLKPGLLVAKDNPRARKLYEHIGFRKVGDRPFMGIVMDHLQLPKT